MARTDRRTAHLLLILLSLVAARGALGASQERLAARLHLPPAEFVDAGATITGTVTVDAPPARVDPTVGSLSANLSGLVVDVGGKPRPVSPEGRFVFEAPLAGAQVTIGVRDPARPMLLPVEDVFSIAGVSERPSEAPPGSGDPRSPQWTAPPAANPGEPFVIRGASPAGGVGVGTRLYAGAQEMPLLWQTPRAIAGDAATIPAGPHVLTVFQDGKPLAAGLFHNVVLLARSDKSKLRPGERATFSVEVSGLPRELLERLEREEPKPGTARAFLDYVNHTPGVGGFSREPDRFSHPILARDLFTRPGADLSAWRRGGAVVDDPELLQLVELELRDLLSAYGSDRSAPGVAPTPAICGVTDVRHYRARARGDFVVNVTVRLPEEATRPQPLQVFSPPQDPAQDPAQDCPGTCRGVGGEGCESSCEALCERRCGGSQRPDCRRSCRDECETDCDAAADDWCGQTCTRGAGATPAPSPTPPPDASPIPGTTKQVTVETRANGWKLVTEQIVDDKTGKVIWSGFYMLAPTGERFDFFLTAGPMGGGPMGDPSFPSGGPRPGAVPAPAPASAPAPDLTRLLQVNCFATCQCYFRAWERSDREALGEAMAEMNRSNPGWKVLTAKAYDCDCEKAKDACYRLMDADCEARCRRHFESGDIIYVGASPGEPNWGAGCIDVGPCPTPR